MNIYHLYFAVKTIMQRNPDMTNNDIDDWIEEIRDNMLIENGMLHTSPLYLSICDRHIEFLEEKELDYIYKDDCYSYRENALTRNLIEFIKYKYNICN